MKKTYLQPAIAAYAAVQLQTVICGSSTSGKGMGDPKDPAPARRDPLG